MRPLTDSDARRLLDVVGSRPARQRLVLRLLFEYDLTAQEICRLTGGDVTARAIRVLDKRGGSRTVELRDDAAADLAELRAGGEGDQLLAGCSGPLRPDSVARLLADVAMDTGLDSRPSIHSARRLADIRS